MSAVEILPLYNEFLDYLIEKATPDEILAFKASQDAQLYARELLERNSAGTITSEEQLQLEQMLQFERLMSVLKAKAIAALKRG